MTVTPNAKLLTNLRWFIDHLDTPPARIHTRGVWHDFTGGSVLGAPMTSRDFALWLEAGERSTRVNTEDVPCLHPRRPIDGGPCPDCVVFTCDGEVERERGTIQRRTEVYRWPMRAAMAKLRRIPVRRGRPDLALTLSTIARFDGDLITAASVLALTFPAMGDPDTAAGHFAYALNRVQNLYRETPPPPMPSRPEEPKSDAQLNAESAA